MSRIASPAAALGHREGEQVQRDLGLALRRRRGEQDHAAFANERLQALQQGAVADADREDAHGPQAPVRDLTSSAAASSRLAAACVAPNPFACSPSTQPGRPRRSAQRRGAWFPHRVHADAADAGYDHGVPDPGLGGVHRQPQPVAPAADERARSSGIAGSILITASIGATQ